MRPQIRQLVRVLFASLAALLPGQAAAQAPEDAQLGPGDVVRITVWRKPELSGEFTILPNGSIGHPLYQAVNVRGLAVPALSSRLREFLATYEQNPQLIVEPLLRVAVGGQVRSPGVITVAVGTTIGQAVAFAGGATEQGNISNVRLVRDGRDQRIDLARVGSGAAAVPVRSGDEVYVGRRGNVFRDVIGPFASVLGAAAAILSATR